ncbi:aromatic prenyltransferase [Aspergillus keveii]|uniref:Aromatic prenyltransferase n=1 Tax=Aspergillus keveii TaxID=714993 RepID=A0ABR4GIV8_9EURO
MASSLLHPHCWKLPRSITNFLHIVLSSYIPNPSPSTLQPPIYQQVTDEVLGYLDSHGQYWWQTSGDLLAALLHDANYPPTSQHHILTFFGRTIAPYMGQAYNPLSPQWRSFMTDDHHPIELSWDWHTGRKPPTVRFSIEPVGLQAGTSLDPDNSHADTVFRKALLKALPETNMEWFHHFDHELAPVHRGDGLMEGHPSKLFYAFDLTAKSITAKAYFFPSFKARETCQSNLQVMAVAIVRAPYCTPSSNQLRSLHVFEDFVRDTSTPQLEMDMLAIDMEDPSTSRLKIYFRNRASSFASVRQMMTLGGRIANPAMERGLHNLRRLWNAMLGQDGIPDDQPLVPAAEGSTNHRTAGLLYNVELPAGTTEPKVKIYIPVRHYASSDECVMSAIHAYMECVAGNGNGLEYGYAETMQRLFRPDAMQQRGLHTYIGCSVQAGGDLRVVSYVNCQGEKMVR